MTKANDWHTASERVRDRLREEMRKKLRAIKPEPGKMNRPYGSVAILAKRYGLTSTQLTNIVNQKKYYKAHLEKNP